MLIWCLIIISYVGNSCPSKEKHLFEIKIFCNIINIVTVAFDQCNESLLNIKYSFLSLKKTLTDPKMLRTFDTFSLRVYSNSICFLCAHKCPEYTSSSSSRQAGAARHRLGSTGARENHHHVLCLSIRGLAQEQTSGR